MMKMLFITNRVLKQGSETELGRQVDFNLADNNALQSLFFCERKEKGVYTELGSEELLGRLRASKAKSVLFYIHGFNNLPEDAAFQQAENLQSLFDTTAKNLVEVVPLIWPCKTSSNAFSKTTIEAYFGDQTAADLSGYAFARALERLRDWQDAAFKQASESGDRDGICLKRLHILAHSMGNRVLRQTMQVWVGEHLRQSPPMLFANSFMVAADIVNESLQKGKEGEWICYASHNVVVYYSAGDLAMRASKGANLRNSIASRRLGHTGPENWDLAPRNVSAVDCRDVSNVYDPPLGHTYFLQGNKKKAGLVFQHIASTIATGKVDGNKENEVRSLQISELKSQTQRSRVKKVSSRK